MNIEDTIYSFRKELQTLGYSKNVADNYPKYAQNLLNYNKKESKSITDLDIKNYHTYLKNIISIKTKKPLSESHIYSQLLAVKLYFDYLERNLIIKRNPYNLKIKQLTKNERLAFTTEEIQILYENCKTLTELVILHLCYGCGLRRNEAVNLNVKDINFEKKLLYIRKGKGKKRRVIPLTETILKDFEKLRIKNAELRKEEEQSFLINKNGLRMHGQQIYETFKKLLKRTTTIHYTLYTLHSLRHSIATHLLENEMSIEMVRDFLGHKQLGTTQIYTRVNQFKMNSLK